MLERSAVVEQFSTFIELADDRFKRWITDVRLARHTRAALNRINYEQDEQAQATAKYLITYWYKCWRLTGGQDNRANLPYGHLAAYLQETCYWAASKTARFSAHYDGLADYFQIAIARLGYVLDHFSPERGSRLDTYAHTAFNNIIRDTLRQRKELDICSDWALLRRLSQKRLEEALLASGLGDKVSPYVLAWRCFKAIYVPSADATRQLNQPSAELWQAIAHQFNQQRQTSAPVPPSADGATLNVWLRHCAAAARSYLYPKATSLNTSRLGGGDELQDTLSDPTCDSLLDALALQEEIDARQHQQTELDRELRQALEQLPPEAQDILALYYRQGQTQQQIAQSLSVQQYTVSRRLSKVRETLLKQISLWSRDTLHISLNTDVLKGMSTVLEEWLYSYYSAAE